MHTINSAVNYNTKPAKTVTKKASCPASSQQPNTEEAVSTDKTQENTTPAYVYSKSSTSSEQEKTSDDIQLERFREMLEKIRTQNKNNFKIKKTKVQFSAVNELIQLANSETVSQANAVLSRVRLKYSNTINSDDSEVLALRKAMLKVIRKARQKIKKLKSEACLNTKKKNAESEQKKELVKKLERELSMRKRNRKAKEQNDILEAQRDEIINRSNSANNREDSYTAYLESRISSLEAAPEVHMADSTMADGSCGGGSADSTGSDASAAETSDIPV